MSGDSPLLDSVRTALLQTLIRIGAVSSGDLSTAYTAGRAAIYRAMFARCAQAAARLSPSESDALARVLLPEDESGAPDPLTGRFLPCEPHNPRLWGRLHEHLLAHQAAGEPPHLRLIPTSRNRRAQGSYYTPEAVVRFIVRQAIGPVLDERLDRVRRRWRKNARTDSDELFTFSVLDPALGTGYFLLEALEFITSRLLTFLEEFPDHPLRGDGRNVRHAVLTRCLYGIDLDPQAVGLARMSLWLTAQPDAARPEAAALVAHLVSGNALLDAERLLPCTGFDAVIGNPPYVPWHAIGSYRTELEAGHYRGCTFRARPNHADAQPNLYLFFLVLMLDLLRPGGRGCFILPPEWLSERRAASFVDHIARQSEEGALVMFDPTLRLFDQGDLPVGTASVILGIRKRNAAPVLTDSFPSLDALSLAETDTAAALHALDLLNLWSLENAPVRGSFRQLVVGNSHPTRRVLGANAPEVPLISTGDRTHFEIGGGFQPPMALVPCFTLDEAAYRDLPLAERSFVFPALVRASSITRYCLRSEGNYWIILNAFPHEAEAQQAAPTLWAMLSRHRTKLESARGPAWWHFPNPRNLATLTSRIPRLLTPRTAARNSFALDTTGYLFKGTNAYIRVLPPYDPAYVLALLNSRLLDCYYVRTGQAYHGSARKYEPGKIAHFPIRRIDFTTPASARRQAARAVLDTFLASGSPDDLLASAIPYFESSQADVVHDVLAELARAQSESVQVGHDQAIDWLVEALYGLTCDQVALLEHW